jgi:2-keto-4-pentenoate hydratase
MLSSTRLGDVIRVMHDVAQQLLDEHRRGAPFKPFAADNGIYSLGAAYRVQADYVAGLQAAGGGARVGYKIGLTSKAMQSMCGIDSPVAGVVLAGSIFSSPARLSGRAFGRLGVEFEIAVRLGRDVLGDAAGRPRSLQEVAESVDGVCAALELVDDRHCDYGTLDVLSLIADNAWNAGMVLSPFVTRWPELSEMEGVISADGIELGRGSGRDALGHPFVPLTWLANNLIDAGSYLRAGDVVLTGSLIKTQFPQRTTRYEFNLGDLSAASCEAQW